MGSLRVVTHFRGLEGKLRTELEEGGGSLSGLRGLLHEAGRAVAECAQAQLDARTIGPSTGNLRRSIQVSRTFKTGESTMAVQVGSDLPYALFVEQGTGLWGPRHRIIRPRNGPIMVFRSQQLPGRPEIHTRKSIGQHGKHYLGPCASEVRRILSE